jgi:UDP-glucose 4-epimerase
MLHHRNITIFGDGEQSRDFIYVNDIVDGICATMQALHKKKFLHSVFNLCTGRSTSINALAKVAAELTDTRSTITHVPARAADIRHSLGSTKHAEETIGFLAQVDFKEGLARTLAGLRG